MSSHTTPARVGVDVRGPRFAAWLTTGVLGLVLIISAFSPAAAAVTLSIQAVVFAVGAAFGPRRHPYGLLFSTFVLPRLGPVREREAAPPLKFAQLVGLVFALCGITGFAVGPVVVGVVATSFALAAAFLNAAFGSCLGCQLYPLLARQRRGTVPA
ncbi:DUF4395 domain-containing protein [Mycobacterium kansasii]|uniref:DUF4395 domain-containing protein n=1 Tax=Mycobacterium pseudokansasii TaxID=2341080 RepID=A0A498QZB4_9MYCO|nr:MULTISPECIES: DUF4395 domain-containing protein [Mycobacterium]KZS64524.1 hypothetical protein A4G27_10070 [Mycobacterium kansasii]MBY0388841.1 DUF4395 domain-containing protein [Mycobacterium pseudokansasii]ORC11163.1 hypothetical protein B1T46_10540 [Mycobacterium kansasii]POX90332.1 DUF4395 domain-containing protein [Mycobacterium kansasii]VAZ80179.1 hypothetical protein LAUMK7_05222 [Mycobacterium kansasii]